MGIGRKEKRSKLVGEKKRGGGRKTCHREKERRGERRRRGEEGRKEGRKESKRVLGPTDDVRIVFLPLFL